MISSLGAGPSGMASMHSMRQQAFNKADSSGNGALEAAEFKQLVSQIPSGRGLPAAQDADNLFRRADADGNGSLSSLELQQGMEQAMVGMRGTAAGAGAGATNAGGPQQDAWKALLDALQQPAAAAASASASASASSATSSPAQAAQRAYAGTPSVGLSLTA